MIIAVRAVNIALLGALLFLSTHIYDEFAHSNRKETVKETVFETSVEYDISGAGKLLFAKIVAKPAPVVIPPLSLSGMSLPGIIFNMGSPERSLAILQVDGKGTLPYRIGREIKDGIVLEHIGADFIIAKRGEKTARLELADTKGAGVQLADTTLDAIEDAIEEDEINEAEVQQLKWIEKQLEIEMYKSSGGRRSELPKPPKTTDDLNTLFGQPLGEQPGGRTLTMKEFLELGKGR